VVDDKVEAALQELSDFSSVFNESMNKIRNEREEYWNSLTKDQQLKCFCAVVERILEGETEGRSYRGMLYTVFGFGPESYAQAQMAGFLTIHNEMFASQNQRHVLEAFAKHAGIENPEETVSNYYMDTL
jgi:hypothetical protein